MSKKNLSKKMLMAATIAGAFLLSANAGNADPTNVSTWDELKTGLTSGSNMNMTGDITVTESFGVSDKENTIIMGGNTLSGGEANTNGFSIFGGSLTLRDGGIISGFDRSGTANAGVLNIQGAAFSLTGGDFTFDNNKSTRGVVQVWESANPSSSTISSNVNSLIFNNNTSTMGGAIYHEQRYSDSSVVSALNGTSIAFTNNSATAGNGGAILNVVGNLSVLGDTNTFSGNSRTAASVETKLYKRGGGAIANASGESIDGTSATMIIGSSTSTNTFTNNTSDTNGGAIMNRAVDIDKSAALTINGSSVFSGNTAEKNGGAIYNMRELLTFAADEHTANVTINGESTFTNNTAKGRGGAIYNSGNMSIANSSFTGNHTIGTGYYEETDAEYPAYIQAQGGAIYNSGRENVWTGGSDARFTYNGILNISNANFGIENDTTSGNSSLQGGAIANTNANALAGEITLTNVNFYNNNAYADTIDDGYNYSSLGGAIWNQGTMTVNGNTTFKGNTTTGYNPQGGAIYNSGTMTFNDAVTFDSNISERTIAGNGAQGGAINNEGTMTFKDAVTFTGNQAVNTVGQTSGLTYLAKGGCYI